MLYQSSGVRAPWPKVPAATLVGRRLILWAFLAPMAFFNARAEIFYDNTQNYLRNSYTSTNEFGDEIRLVEGPRDITNFSFEYFGEFVPTGLQTVRLRFYANDGDDTDPGPKLIPAPGSMLYDSGSLPIAPGYNAVSVLGISVHVPRTFTWTVEFSGMAAGNQDTAGLLFYSPPTVGSSFDDFWHKVAGVWTLYRLGGNPVANFGSRAVVTPETPLSLEPVELGDGQVQLLITGPIGRSFELEFSTNSTHWSSLQTLLLTNRTLSLIHSPATNSTNHVYRATLLPDSLMQFVSSQPTAGGMRLRYGGPSGVIYELQTSVDLVNWLTILTGNFPLGIVEHVDPPKPVPYRFYRLRAVPTIAAQFDVSASHQINQVFQIGLSGPPGKHVVIQASGDLVNWTSISTNQFSFTSGAITLIDAQASASDRKFYRVRPLE